MLIPFGMGIEYCKNDADRSKCIITWDYSIFNGKNLSNLLSIEAIRLAQNFIPIT